MKHQVCSIPPPQRLRNVGNRVLKLTHKSGIDNKLQWSGSRSGGVTLYEIVRTRRFCVFAAGNGETRTDSSLEFAVNVRMPEARWRAT